MAACCDFHSDDTVWVAFSGRYFKDAKGDDRGRAAAIRHGSQAGVPSAQLDWREDY